MIKMKITYILLVILTIAISSPSSHAQAQPYNDPLFISCGLPKSATANSENNRKWKSDDNLTFAPPDINTISTTATATEDSEYPPYDTARIFHSPLTYTFSLTPGPKFIRLYFTNSITSYNNITPSQVYLSLEANHVIFFKNFSPFLNPNQTMYEFHLTIEKSTSNVKNLNLTFSPGDNGANNSNNSTSTHSYGFINAIEIVPVPQGLYINLTNTGLKDLSNPNFDYTPSHLTALQNIVRLNVGGSTVNPSDDSGSMWRTWLYDRDYLKPGGIIGTEGGLTPAETNIPLNYTIISDYVAPRLVYATVRTIGPYSPKLKLKSNLTWRFEVDSGFNYLIRLHFCDMDKDETGSGERLFDVYINNQTADSRVDVWDSSGGRGVPIYRDYVIRVDGGASGGVSTANTTTKVPFWLALHPQLTLITDVLLNGLEIFKLSESNRNTQNLAAPNTIQPTNPPTILDGNETNHHHPLAIIGGAIGGAILVSLLLCASLVVYKRRAKKEDIFRSKSTATNTSSKFKWIQTFFDSAGSTASTVSSSLPSDLCRRFTLAQIRVATCDFDDNLIIGKGGFGKVYKGTIMDGGSATTQVAVKRLNTTSKQGAHEFQNEIEMLSRLRHVHLVSLIGYCEDHGEMILVYEYMPHGSLRDHLMYRNPEKNNDNDNNTPLSWKQRLVTCVGAARGLHYLHAGARQLIIHRDVKSTNILLDNKWTAKVSDFGLSKAGPIPNELGPTHISTAVKGSAGYLDPEYYQRHRLTEKSDVYSFGVVLFEVLCARAAVNPKLPKEQANLAMWARNHYKRGTLQTIVDPNLTGQIAPECLRKFGEIAEMCVRDRGSERPSMGDVVWGLEFALKLQQTADSNNIGGGPLVEDLGPTSTNLDGGNSGNTDNDVFSTSGDNFSRSSVGGAATNRLLDSRTTTSNSSDCLVDMKSDAVFSEIIDPTAR